MNYFQPNLVDTVFSAESQLMVEKPYKNQFSDNLCYRADRLIDKILISINSMN